MLNVTLVLVPRFPLLSLSICTETLRVANLERGGVGYSWTVATVDGGAVESSSGLQMSANVALSEVTRAETVVMLASYEPEAVTSPELFSWLRRQDRLGAHIACVDTGGYLLAKAGIIRDRPVAVHRESRPGYRELYPDLDFPDRKLIHADRLSSSAGGFATFEMMLDLVERRDGPELAERVAHVLYYGAARPEADQEAPPLADRRLGRLLEVMRSALAEPLALDVVCRRARLAPATAARLCKAALGRPPGRVYLDLRLERARYLLLNSVLPVAMVAEQTGFQNPSAFSRAFKKRYGVMPSESRHRASNLGAPDGWAMRN